MLAFLLAIQSGCRGPAADPATAGPDRVVVTYTENLSGDAALDGAARVISHLVRSRLSGSRSLAVFEAAHESEAVRRRAGRIVRSWLDSTAGKLQLHVTVRNAAGKTVEQWQASAASAEGPAKLADTLVRRLAPSAEAASEPPAGAAALLGQALIASREDAIPLLERTVALAPAWGDPYYLLGAHLAAAGRKDDALRVWNEGVARAGDPLSEARMSAGVAAAGGDSATLAEATEKLATLLPAEPEHAMHAGTMRLDRGEFAKAAEWMAKAVAAEPGAGEWWNQLAFAQAFSGNEKAAFESLRRYEQLDPKRGNPADSRGEVQFMLGRFKEASASFAEAFAREPGLLSGATLFRAAQALRMAGDEAAAAKEIQRYWDGPLKGHPLRDLFRLRWEYRGANKRQAAERMAALAAAPGTQPDLASACYAQLAFWHLFEGNRTKASEFARAAMQEAQSVPARREALTAFYLSQPPADAGEWKRRAKGNPPPDLLALALVLDGKWKDALPVLDELNAKTQPFRAGHWRVFRAWALLETGSPAKARESLRWYPVPLLSGDPAIEPFVMEKALELRMKFGG